MNETIPFDDRDLTTSSSRYLDEYHILEQYARQGTSSNKPLVDYVQVRIALEALEPEEALFLKRIYINGESVLSVSKDLGIAYNTLKRRVQKALLKMDTLMEERI